MSVIETSLRSFGVIALIVLAVILFSTRRRDHVGQVGAALSVSVAAFLVTSSHGVGKALGPLIYPLSAICSTHPVWFWLFCSILFGDVRRLTRTQVFCIVAMSASGFVYWLLWPDEPWFSQPLGVALGVASLVFICLGPISVFQGRALDLDERRRRIRAVFVPVVSGYLAAVALVQIIVLIASRPTPSALVLLNLAVIDVIAIAALLSFVQIRVLNWLAVADPVPDTRELNRVERRVLQQLQARLAPERLYAREGLTIALLAERLQTQEHVLRRVINHGLGFRNFNDFLHTHRLREAALRLRDSGAARVPVLTIALEVGYGSIGPFNRAFRERFGMTPTEYRRAGEGGSGAVGAPDSTPN